MSIVRLVNVKKSFTNYEGNLFLKKVYTNVLNGINLEIKRGETFAIVGESGCGKTTLVNAISKLINIDSGEIYFNNIAVHNLKNEDLRKFRKNIGMIFQDPKSSLNPHYKVKWILNEPFLAHNYKDIKENYNKIKELLYNFKLSEKYLDRYVNDLSGGEAQRIAIISSLLLEPELIIADEAVSALDVSIQAEVLNYFNEMKKIYNPTILFITHDLAVSKYISDRIGVMYFGNLVEIANSEEIYSNPIHPYTKLLLASSFSMNRNITEEELKEFEQFKIELIRENKVKPFIEVNNNHFVRI